MKHGGDAGMTGRLQSELVYKGFCAGGSEGETTELVWGASSTWTESPGSMRFCAGAAMHTAAAMRGKDFKVV